MKKLFLALVLLSAVGHAQQKFACVDTNRITAESQYVKQKESQLREKAQEYQKKLEQIGKRLEELKRQIESKGLAQNVREQKIKEYQKVEAEGLELQQKAQRDIAETKSQMEQEILERVRRISQELAKAHGFSGIFDCGALVYISPEMDITKEVIQRLDQQK